MREAVNGGSCVPKPLPRLGLDGLVSVSCALGSGEGSTTLYFSDKTFTSTSGKLLHLGEQRNFLLFGFSSLPVFTS